METPLLSAAPPVPLSPSFSSSYGGGGGGPKQVRKGEKRDDDDTCPRRRPKKKRSNSAGGGGGGGGDGRMRYGSRVVRKEGRKEKGNPLYSVCSSSFSPPPPSISFNTSYLDRFRPPSPQSARISLTQRFKSWQRKYISGQKLGK